MSKKRMTKNQLQKLLSAEPELETKLIEALETGKFLITVTLQKKYRPDDKCDLHHYWMRKDFMVQEVASSLRHIIADFTAKENPTADLEDKTSWH